MFTLFVVMSLCADPVDLPENVQKWRDTMHKIHGLRVADAEKKLDDAKRELKNPEGGKGGRVTPAQKKYRVDKVKEATAEVKAAEAKSPYDYTVGLSYKPAVGDIGSVGRVRIVDANDDVAVIELTGPAINQQRAGGPNAKNRMMLEGVDTSKWPNGQMVQLDGYFEAVRVDKETRMVVLAKFDVEKWKPLLDKKPETKTEEKPKPKK